jgi:hypothetical protein
MAKNPLFKAPLLSFTNTAPGKWLVFEKFGTPVKAILYDGDRGKTVIVEAKAGEFKTTEIEGVVTLKGMTWPNAQHLMKFRWTETVPDEETAKTAVYSVGHPRAGQKKYASCKKFLHSGIIIGTREEDNLPYLRQKEIHPVAIEFICRSGGSYVIVVQVTVEIHNPMAAIQLENFLESALGRVTEAILSWGKSKTFEEARAINVDDHKQIMVKDKQGNSRYYLEVINEDLKEKLGITIPDVTQIEHFIGDASKKVFESENNTLEEGNKVKQAAFKKEARLEENIAQDAENKTELAFQTSLLDKIGEVQGKLLDKQIEIAKGYAGKNGLTYLSTGDTGKGASLPEILAALNSPKNKKGGGNATA